MPISFPSFSSTFIDIMYQNKCRRRDFRCNLLLGILLPSARSGESFAAGTISKLVKGNNNKDAGRGRIFITQTYQRKTPFFLPYVKPLLKYATTIDFGQLIREEQVLQTFNESGGLEVVEHNVTPGSIDSAYQAAYLSVCGEHVASNRAFTRKAASLPP